MKISVIGDGGWGTALAMLLCGYGHDVTMWGPFPEYTDEMRKAGENFRYLPGVRLPAALKHANDPAEAVDGSDCVVLASPSKFYESVCEKFKGLVADGSLVVSVTKGLDEKTHSRMSEIASATLGVKDVVVLSGPSHAEEVSRGLPTAVVAACADESLANAAQKLFSGPRFRVYTGTDPLGVEIGGAVKNVIAVAVGVSDGMGFGDNTRAALISRGLAEMTRFGCAFGARPETFTGLSGIGDLVVTCCSRHSRNHAVGERLGRGERIGEILSSMKMVAEGVWNSHIVNAMAEEKGVDMPITAVVHQFCDNGISPHAALESLMGRESKPEKFVF